MRNRYRLICLGALCLALTARADMQDIEGRWLTQDGDGWIRLQVKDGTLQGLIAGAPPGSPSERKFDDRNPEPLLRSRLLKGLVIMTGFEYAGDGRWKNGDVYDPDTGNTYRCTVTLLDANTVKIKGYIGIPLFGRSAKWTRDDPG